MNDTVVFNYLAAPERGFAYYKVLLIIGKGKDVRMGIQHTPDL